MIGGQKHWLWRAVDQDGYILDEIIQTRRPPVGEAIPVSMFNPNNDAGSQVVRRV